MSRIGRRPIAIPAGVEVMVEDGNNIRVKGPMGELCEQVCENITVTVADGTVEVARPDDTRVNRAQHGLARTLIANMIEGVTNGYQKKLIINGVGYSVSKSGNTLTLKLGFSLSLIHI